MKVAYTCNLDWKTHNTIWCRERCQIFRQKPLVSINLCVYCAVPKNLLIINSHVNYTACEKERNQGSEKKRKIFHSPTCIFSVVKIFNIYSKLFILMDILMQVLHLMQKTTSDKTNLPHINIQVIILQYMV